MLTINEETFRDNLDWYLDEVADKQEIILVKRENGKNVVIIPEELYTMITENSSPCEEG